MSAAVAFDCGTRPRHTLETRHATDAAHSERSRLTTMSTDLGAALPTALLGRLKSPAPGGEGIAVPICTVDGAGFPHPAMLSYAELAAMGPSDLQVSVYAGSRTAQHLAGVGRVTLLFVDERGAYYVKARSTGASRPHPGRPDVAIFDVHVAAVLEDAADPSRERQAAITSGIRFRRAEGGATR